MHRPIVFLRPAWPPTSKSHELRVLDLKDLSGNKTDETKQFSISTDTTAPVASVVVKDENTLTLNFDEPVKSVDSTNVKVLKGNINVTGVVGTLSADGKSVDVQVNPLVFGTNETSANLSVEISGVKDVYDNAMAKVTQNVTVVKDVVAPAVTKVEGTVGTKTITLTFSEELAGVAGADVAKPSLFKDNMKLSIASAKLQADKDGHLTQVVVTTDADLVAGNYDVTLVQGSVTDDTLAKNPNAAVKLALTTTSPSGTTDTGKPELKTVAVNGDKLTLTYSEDVSATAVDFNNYKINGNVIPAQSVVYFDNNKKTVVIELPTGYFTADKADNIFEASNVTDLAGNAMNKFTQLDLQSVDTKAPSLVSAKVASADSIVLEFNENIDTTFTSFAPGKVTIKNAGSTVLDGSGNPITGSAAASVDGKKVTITLATGKTLDLTKSYTVDFEAGNGLVDESGTDNDGTGVEVAPFSNVALVDGVAPAFKATDDFFADTIFNATTGVIGVTAPAVSTTAFAIKKSNLTELPSAIKLVYSDSDANTADVVVSGTVEVKADQSAYTYSFGSANLSSLTVGAVNVKLVLVDANGNESTGYNVVTDGTGTAVDTLTLVK